MIFVRTFVKKSNYVKELGRWKTDKTVNCINKTIDFANHDHCGGELCKIPYTKSNKKLKDEEQYNKKDNNYYLPFIVSD